ncbi:MAG: hypothetical protein IJ104_00760 [Methanobrevibacter sp.]|nr:hypothetical protein [Methanobrevibacter sp.]MBQ9024900.1 hypothetical protein [Methanobrevibacter sp.]
MVAYKIRRNYNRNGPLTRNPFYINVADLHLPRPKQKNNNDDGVVDGYPIIQISTGRMQ